MAVLAKFTLVIIITYKTTQFFSPSYLLLLSNTCTIIIIIIIHAQLNTLYVVLGPRQNIIVFKILSESKRNELKCSLKLIVMFLSIIVK